MNSLTQTFAPPRLLRRSRVPMQKGQPYAAFECASTVPCNARAANLGHKLELAALVLLLICLNWTLLKGASNRSLMFMPDAATHGEWWRWFTHPFIHVTWWHLVLDGAAFLMLYRDLQEQSWGRRILLCVGSGVGSVAICFAADPTLSIKGLCGISGIAHGLMAVSAFNLMAHRHDKLLFGMGICSFVLVTAKCLIEALSGKMLFTFLYFGMVGDPVAVTHAGGLLGALFTWLLLRTLTTRDVC